MEKLFYLIKPNVFKYQGVRNKVFSQIKSMKNNDIDVTLVIVGGDESLIMPRHNGAEDIKIICLRHNAKNKILPIIEDYIHLLKFVTKLGKRDVIYTRYDVNTIFLMPRDCKIITEHNTKEIVEYNASNIGFSIDPFVEKLFGRLNRKLRDNFVAVTQEIQKFEANYYGKRGSTVISNGIDVVSIPVSDRKGPITEDFHLLGLANVSNWHGYDRVIRGIKNYNSNIKVFFHIVGDGSEIPILKKLAMDLCIENLIIFHGRSQGVALDELVNKCHMAVGVWGVYRINMLEGSNIKHREYCARGIPFVDSTIDIDFENFSYRYRIGNDDEDVNIEKLILFFNECSKTDYPTIMRRYSIDRLDWSTKMKDLHTFIEQISREKS